VAGRPLFLICLGLLALVAIAYWPVLRNGFVSYDDNVYVTENPNVTCGLTVDSVIWAFTSFYASNWHPLTWLSHMLDCQVYGLRPLGHHITNVLLHAATCLLLFLAFQRMTKALWPAAFVAALFAVHPLHVESVAWAAERKDVLCAFFWMLTITAYIRYAGNRSIGRYLAVAASFAAALMSKPMAVTLPFVLLLLDYWPLEKVMSGSQDKSPGRDFSLLRSTVEKAPLFAMSVAACVATLVAQRRGGSVSSFDAAPLVHRFANACTSYVLYIRNILWPDHLAVLYPISHVNQGIALLCAACLLAATILSICFVRGRRYVAVGWLWYLGTLVPVIGLVQVGSQAMADRYMYVPAIGLAILVAWTAKDLVAARPALRPAVIGTAVLSITAMVVQTKVQLTYWQDSLTLFSRALQVTVDNAIAENGYGVALLRAGKAAEAETHLARAFGMEESLRRSGSRTWWLVGNNLSLVLLEQGKYGQAIACLDRLVERRKDSPEVYARLASAWMGKGDVARATENWTRARELGTSDPQVLNNLAWLWATTPGVSPEDTARAVEYGEQACRLTRYLDANCLDTLAAAYASVGRYGDAIATAEKAIALAHQAGKVSLAAQISAHARLFRDGRPCRSP
jgi:protein O-mannosyl-transferase